MKLEWIHWPKSCTLFVKMWTTNLSFTSFQTVNFFAPTEKICTNEPEKNTLIKVTTDVTVVGPATCHNLIKSTGGPLFCCMLCSMSGRRYFYSFVVIFLQFSDKHWEISPNEKVTRPLNSPLRKETRKKKVKKDKIEYVDGVIVYGCGFKEM